MKKSTSLYMAFWALIFIVFSCNSKSDSDKSNSETNTSLLLDSANTNTKSDSIINMDFVPEIDQCGTRLVNDFKSFMGLKYGDEEKLLTAKVGSFTKGNYSTDSSYFIYYYDQVPRAPLQIWVHAKTGKIITVFIEVLSLKSLFNEDLASVKAEFPFNNCELKYMGLTADQIIEKLGEPAEDAVSKDDVRLLTYDSDDYKIAVAFKIYPQENKCSSIAVNWFYENQ